MSATQYVVELERGVWLAPWAGDPGRTLARNNAKRFSRVGAALALTSSRKYRPFKTARIYPAAAARPVEKETP